jgi:hypothetical protein
MLSPQIPSAEILALISKTYGDVQELNHLKHDKHALLGTFFRSVFRGALYAASNRNRYCHETISYISDETVNEGIEILRGLGFKVEWSDDISDIIPGPAKTIKVSW